MGAHMAQAEHGRGDCRLHERAERLRAVRADVFIGIFPVGQEEHAHLRSTSAHGGKCAQGRLLSCCVAVVAEDNARRAAQEQRGMIARKRRAEGRDDVRDARLPCGNSVHIALNDDRRALACNRAVCAVKPEEELSLVEYGRLRRIEVFRLRVAKRTSAEGDDAPALIRDGDHDAIAEAVIYPPAALTSHGKPCRHENMLGYAALLKGIGELRPRVGREADPIARNRLVRDAAAREVLFSRCAVARHGETVVKEVTRERIHLAQIVQLPETRLLARVTVSLGLFDAELLRLPEDRLKRRDMLHERDEFERVAARMAAEAVEEAVGGYDGERRGLFVVKGAAAPVAVALALQRDIALHDGKDVGLRAHLLHKGLHPWVTHRCLLIYCKLW